MYQNKPELDTVIDSVIRHFLYAPSIYMYTLLYNIHIYYILYIVIYVYIYYIYMYIYIYV